MLGSSPMESPYYSMAPPRGMTAMRSPPDYDDRGVSFASESPFPESPRATGGTMKHQRTIVILGSNGVGKSSIVRQYCEDSYTSSYLPTIQNAFRKEAYWDGHPVDLVIRDTAGQSEVSQVRLQFGAGVHGYIIMYSVASQQTLTDAKFIRDNLLTNLMGTTDDIPIVLVGNKCDLEAERRVPYQDGRAVAQLWKCPFVETSAKNNEHVDEVFSLLLAKIYKGEYTPPKRPRCCTCRCRADQMTHAQQTRMVHWYIGLLFLIMVCSLFTILAAVGYASDGDASTEHDKLPTWLLLCVGVLGLLVSSMGAYGSLRLRAGWLQTAAVGMVILTLLHVGVLVFALSDPVFDHWLKHGSSAAMVGASILDVLAQVVAAALSCVVFSIAAQTFEQSYTYAPFERHRARRSSVGARPSGHRGDGAVRVPIGERRLSWGSGERTREH